MPRAAHVVYFCCPISNYPIFKIRLPVMKLLFLLCPKKFSSQQLVFCVSAIGINKPAGNCNFIECRCECSHSAMTTDLP